MRTLAPLSFLITIVSLIDGLPGHSVRKTQAAIRASKTTVHLGSKLAVSKLSTPIQVISAHGEFGPVNSENILWRLQPATLATSASEPIGKVISAQTIVYRANEE